MGIRVSTYHTRKHISHVSSISYTSSCACRRIPIVYHGIERLIFFYSRLMNKYIDSLTPREAKLLNRHVVLNHRNLYKDDDISFNHDEHEVDYKQKLHEKVHHIPKDYKAIMNDIRETLNMDIETKYQRAAAALYGIGRMISNEEDYDENDIMDIINNFAEKVDDYENCPNDDYIYADDDEYDEEEDDNDEEEDDDNDDSRHYKHHDEDHDEDHDDVYDDILSRHLTRNIGHGIYG